MCSVEVVFPDLTLPSPHMFLITSVDGNCWLLFRLNFSYGPVNYVWVEEVTCPTPCYFQSAVRQLGDCTIAVFERC